MYVVFINFYIFTKNYPQNLSFAEEQCENGMKRPNNQMHIFIDAFTQWRTSARV